jgi:hypothetical protein
LSKADLAYVSSAEMSKWFLQYANDVIRNMNNQSYAGFLKFITSKFQKEVEKAKIEKGKAAKQQLLDDMVSSVKANATSISAVLDVHSKIADIKDKIIDELDTYQPIRRYFENEFGSLVKTNPEGYVSILGDSSHSGGFKILAIGDEYTFTVRDSGTPITASISTWRMQKAQARTLIYGRKNSDGIQIQMIWSGTNEGTTSKYIEIGSFRVLINDLEILSPFGAGIDNGIGEFIPTLDDWYGFVFNFSNAFKQYSINVWKMLYDPENTASQTSDLGLVHIKEGLNSQKYMYSIPSDIELSNQTETFKSDNNSYKVLGGHIYLSNLRIFQNMIEKEKQSAILNQNVVNDSQLAIIIDNAKPVLKLAKIAKNR